MSTDPLPVARAGRRRFWIAILCFALLNVAAWIGYDRYIAGRFRGTLRVESFEPGDNSTITGHSTLRWHFSNDCLPTAAYGKDPGTLIPTVAGRWDWENPRTLSFTPATAFPKGTPITASLNNAFLRTPTGAALDKPYVTTLKCDPLRIEEVRQTSAAELDRFIVEIHFSDTVDPNTVISHLVLNRKDGHKVSCTLHGAAIGSVVRVITEPVPPAEGEIDTTVAVHITPGIVGQTGPLGLADSFESELYLARSLSFTSLQSESPARGSPRLVLQFNNAVDLSSLKEVLSISPAIPYTLESRGDEAVQLVGSFHAGTRYTVKITAKPKGFDPNKYPRAGELATFVPDHHSGVWFDNDQGYLSTAGNRTLVAHAMNLPALHVSITRMYDNNLVAWRNYESSDRWSYTENYSRPIAEKTIKLPNEKNIEQSVTLSLDDLLPPSADKDGVYCVSLKQIKDSSKLSENDEEEDYRYNNQSASSVVTMSDIGLTAKQTRTGLVAWTTSLRTAHPLIGVRVRLFSNKNQLLAQAVSNEDGVATLSSTPLAKDETPAVVLADFPSENPAGIIAAPLALPTTKPSIGQNEQLTWLDLRRSGWELGEDSVSGREYLRKGNEAFVYTDRGVYRPGETAHLRAIVRGPDNQPLKNAFPVRWQLRRPDSRNWKSQVVTINSDGAAALDIPLPDDLPTGQWTALIGLPGETGPDAKYFGTVQFQLEDFLPNRLKVSLLLGKDQPRVAIGDDELPAHIQGDYLFGRPAAGLLVDLKTNLVPVAFHPTGWNDWTFGDNAHAVTRVPSNKSAKASPRKKEPADPDQYSLDKNGHFDGSIDISELVSATDDKKYTGPWRLTASAGVRETGGRAVTATRQVDVDALSAYIGLRRVDSATALPGKSVSFKLSMVKPSGAPNAENQSELEVKLFRESWNTVLSYKDGRYHYDSQRVLNEESKKTIQLSDGKGDFDVSAKSNGAYVACITDPQTDACTSLEFDVSDGSPWEDNVSRENPDRLTVRLLPAGDAIKASPVHINDTVNVLVESPFAGRLLLSTETDDVIQTTVMDMPASHVVVPVKISEAWRPNAYITATVIRPIDPNAKWRSHRAYGVTRVKVDPTDQQLTIAITAPSELRPLQSLDTTFVVTDSQGRTVSNAALTVAAVDEGICSLTNFTTPDPLAYFSSDRALGVDSADVFGLLMPEVANKYSATGGDGGEALSGRHHSPVVARRVKPVALAWFEAHTDANGVAHASFPLPEFQGKLRVMAIGYKDALFGSNDQGVLVRSPILAQTTWPRFAAPGDNFSTNVSLFNNTAAAGSAVVSVELLSDPGTPAGLMTFGSAMQTKFDLPAVVISPNGQSQTTIPVVIGPAVGLAKVRLTVSMNGEQYEEHVELPVRPAAPSMQFGGYAAASTTQPTTLTSTPLMAGTSSTHVTVTPWPTLNLPRGLDYLNRYPYGCVEQTTSGCFPLIALGDIGKQIDPQRFSPDAIKLKIDAGVMHLIGMQTSEGGLAMWTGERDPWPWASVYAAHFLTEAKIAGYDVQDDFYQHLLGYVRHLMDGGTDDAQQLETQSYAAYVTALAGRVDRPVLNRLTELLSAGGRAGENDDFLAMRSDARLMIASAWAVAGQKDLAEDLLPQQLPLPRKGRQSAENIGSPIRDRALLIQTLLMVQPDNAALPGLVQQLADCGIRREWASTQDTAFAVLAIGRYLRDGKRHQPYESAQLLSGENVLADASSGGSIAWDSSASDKLTVLLKGSADSAGYVSWLQDGVPLTPPADASHGMKVHRRYLTTDGREIKRVVRSGDLVSVEITVQTSPNEPNLVIEDLLPSGFEVENPRLETAAKDVDEKDESAQKQFRKTKLDVRDDRVIIAGSMPSSGTATLTYLARAVTTGTFVVPPVRVEAMYDINTNAIAGAGGTIQVVSATTNIATISE